MSALDVLVEGLFDYAGMYPPASLSFQEALREAARHPRELSRPRLVATDMVVREDLLGPLTDAAFEAAAWPQGAVCTLAVLGVPLEDAEAALGRVLAYNEAHSAAVVPRRVVSLEFVAESDPGVDARARAGLASVAAAHASVPDLRVYAEPRWSPSGWDAGVERLFASLRRAEDEDHAARVGVKVRCGGAHALTHDEMARALAWVVAEGVPFKATQGLHHPVLESSFDNAWGFVNLAMALRLRGALQEAFPTSAILDLLAEDDPAAFRFENEAAAWRGYEVGVKDLVALQETLPFAIGSCSIREPDADLVRLFP